MQSIESLGDPILTLRVAVSVQEATERPQQSTTTTAVLVIFNACMLLLRRRPQQPDVYDFMVSPSTGGGHFWRGDCRCFLLHPRGLSVSFAATNLVAPADAHYTIGEGVPCVFSFNPIVGF